MKALLKLPLRLAIVLLVCFGQLLGCKSEEAPISSGNADLTSNDSIAKCALSSALDDDSESTSLCVSSSVNEPLILSVGETPVVLDRTPKIRWATANSLPLQNLPTQIRVVKASDKSIVYKWAPITGEYVEGLNLIDGQEYFFQMRSVNPNGMRSKVIKSQNWTARVGKGHWGNISNVNAPSTREFFSIVWTGTKMIIWGGQVPSGGAVNTGAVYDPSNDTWTTMSTVNAPPARGNATAIWTGTEMIVWGGPWQKTGARYNPNTNTWTTMSTVNAPIGVAGHSAVWTGNKMIVWGGEIPGYGHHWSGDGGIYDPSNNTWTAISSVGAPSARSQHVAVWTGSEMLIFGGGAGSTYTMNSDGALYNPTTNSWRSMTGSRDIIAGYRQVSGYHWTGTKLIMREGKYDPATNTWEDLAVSSRFDDQTEALYLPASGKSFTATAWTGSHFFSWGGRAWDNVKTGGLYDPATDKWIGTSLSGAPSLSTTAAAVWTGSQILLWNGISGASFTP